MKGKGSDVELAFFRVFLIFLGIAAVVVAVAFALGAWLL
jgi:hypothetical protein